MKLEYSQALRVLIRQGPWEESSIGTVDAIEQLIDEGRLEEAKQMLQYLRSGFESLQDLLVQYVQELLAYIARTGGEEQVGDALRHGLGESVKQHDRYYRTLSPKDQLQIVAEGMRRHLAGPKRQGEFVMIEEADRFVFQFDPCGSGGALRRNAEAQGREVEVFSEPHPWTWGKKGVCLYCAHCAFFNEILPIEQSGYPHRITEYPENPQDPCVWYVYKNQDEIPEEYYRRIGKTKPDVSQQPE